VHWDDSDEADVAAYRQGLADAVNRLLADPVLARDMGMAGRVRAEREFSWVEAARQTVEIYHSVLAEKVFSR
jgi:starch synthase